MGVSRIQELRGVIIGGGSGIGRAAARELAVRGATVIVGDRDIDAANSVAREATTSEGVGTVEAAACDVRDLTSLAQFRAHVVERLGGLDFVVLSVGITQSGGILDQDPARWRDVLETNLLGVAHTLRTFLPDLKIGNAGQAIVLASLSGRETYAGQPIYIGSKWGAIGLTHSVRREAQSYGVRISVVAPGLVDTPMSRHNPQAQPLFDEVTPLQPLDVARAVAFILEQPEHVLIRELAIQPIEQQL